MNNPCHTPLIVLFTRYKQNYIPLGSGISLILFKATRESCLRAASYWQDAMMISILVPRSARPSQPQKAEQEDFLVADLLCAENFWDRHSNKVVVKMKIPNTRNGWIFPVPVLLAKFIGTPVLLFLPLIAVLLFLPLIAKLSVIQMLHPTCEIDWMTVGSSVRLTLGIELQASESNIFRRSKFWLA